MRHGFLVGEKKNKNDIDQTAKQASEKDMGLSFPPHHHLVIGQLVVTMIWNLHSG